MSDFIHGYDYEEDCGDSISLQSKIALMLNEYKECSENGEATITEKINNLRDFCLDADCAIGIDCNSTKFTSDLCNLTHKSMKELFDDNNKCVALYNKATGSTLSSNERERIEIFYVDSML